jgi:hypothetical protein
MLGSTPISLPHLADKWRIGIDNQIMFGPDTSRTCFRSTDANQDWETVAFIPWRNDFFADYLAPAQAFVHSISAAIKT